MKRKNKTTRPVTTSTIPPIQYIQSIELKNVQCHKHALLNFSPGVNMIIGPSDHGKSAIFNAFYKIISNRPAGDEWRTWHSKKSEIEMILSNQTKIRYEKASQAAYFLKEPGKDEIQFKAFGQNVPEEIAKILNMDQKVNIQRQLERGVPIFLIAESPGDVAKHFNSVAGFDVIDSAIAKGKSSIRVNEQKLNELKSIHKSKTEELAKYVQYIRLNMLLVKAEKQQEKITNKNEQFQAIQDLVYDIQKKQRELFPLNKKLKLIPFIKKADILYNKTKENLKQKNEIEMQVGKVIKNQETLNFISKKLTVSGLVDRASVFFKIIQGKLDKKKELELLVRQITEQQNEVKMMLKKYKETKTKFKEVMPEQCPLCGK